MERIVSESDQATSRRQSGVRSRLNALDALALFTRGIAMGVADVIPGVSGGTIALISGIYERFIGALRSLSARFAVALGRGRVRDARREFGAMHWEVLIPLGLGIVIAMLSMSKLVTGLMEDHPGPTYAAFFGLILASSWMPLARTKARSWKLWAALAIAAVGAWLFVGMRAGSSADFVFTEQSVPSTYPGHFFYPPEIKDPAQFEAFVEWVNAWTFEPPPADLLESWPDGEPLYRIVVFDPKGMLDAGQELESWARIVVLQSEAELDSWLETNPDIMTVEEKRASLAFIFVSGMIAISAMILPGVSGSFLLLFLGQYQAVFTAAHRVVGHLASYIGREPDVMTALSGRSAMDDVVFLGVFFAGIGLGVIVFSRVVGWLLDHAHDVTMAALTGLMIGALRQPGGVVMDSIPEGETTSYWVLCGVTALLGGISVLGLHFADVALRKRRLMPEDSQEF